MPQLNRHVVVFAIQHWLRKQKKTIESKRAFTCLLLLNLVNSTLLLSQILGICTAASLLSLGLRLASAALALFAVFSRILWCTSFHVIFKICLCSSLLFYGMQMFEEPSPHYILARVFWILATVILEIVEVHIMFHASFTAARRPFADENATETSTPPVYDDAWKTSTEPPPPSYSVATSRARATSTDSSSQVAQLDVARLHQVDSSPPSTSATVVPLS